jgi:methionine-rich copper-binding protein CopC
MLATTPPRLHVLFDEELDGDGSQIRVLGPRDQRADRRDAQIDGRRMWVSLFDRGPGVYRVRWKAIADDDKSETRGDFSFTIQPQLPAGAPQLSVSPPQANNGQSVTVRA